MQRSSRFLSGIPRRLREERRLIAFATTLAFAAGCLMYLRYNVTVFGMPLPLFTGLFYAGFIGTAVTVTTLLLPALRSLVEAVAISRFGVALAAFVSPEFGVKLIASPILSATVVLLGAFAIRRLLALESLSRWSVTATARGARA